MKAIKYGQLLLLVVSLSAAITACKKPGTENPPVPQVVTVTNIDPATAPAGSTIAVSGTNFSSDPASNTVLIGGVPATIVSATATRIVIVVPSGATGPVSVSANGQTAQSTATFTVANRPTREITGTIRQNSAWSNDTVYILRGLVYVPDRFTLNIEPGTIIKGAAKEQDPEGKGLAGTLIVERGGKLTAVGTATEPIVFTSTKAAGQRAHGDWGGLVLIGKAPHNRPGSTTYAGGVRGTVETYNEPADNSGTLKYVRIEFAGAAQPTADSRLNGLTMYGVGYGTTIDHVQVSYSGADSYAWFGGGVNMKYLVSFRSTDDDWSSDRGYTNKAYSNIVQPGAGGKVQFGIALRDPGVADPSGANAIESQNFDGEGANAGGAPLAQQNGLPQTAPIFANISSFAFGTTPSTTPTARGGIYQAGMYLRGNSAISIYNSVFIGYPEGLRIDGASTLTNATANELDLKGIVIANTLTPLVGGNTVSNDQVTAYFNGAGRSNTVVQDITTLLLNASTFNLTSPNFLPVTGSPLLTGAVTTGKIDDQEKFFDKVSFKGAFGTENWLQGWANFNPQTADYN